MWTFASDNYLSIKRLTTNDQGNVPARVQSTRVECRASSTKVKRAKLGIELFGMITPTFKITQDSDFVTIYINVPHARAQDVDTFVDGSEFRFHLNPYFLRLYFPARLIEDDRAEASYDINTGVFTFKIAKETPGEQFEDLDLLSTLLARKGETKENTAKKPLIEVLSSTDEADAEEIHTSDPSIREAAQFNWELPQQLPDEDAQLRTSTTSRYGFANQYNGYFTHWRETANEIMDISDPEHMTSVERRQERTRYEDEKFDEDYYVADFLNAKDIEHLIKFETIFQKELRRVEKDTKPTPLIQEISPATTSASDTHPVVSDSATLAGPAQGENPSLIKLTEDDERLLLNLRDHERSLYIGLVDLLFAYCYDQRVNEGETNVESCWNMGKLSACMAGLEDPESFRPVLVTSFRRALAYPLYRQFELCRKVQEDVCDIMRLGKRAVLKALLQLKRLFDHHDIYYVYSKIWLDDYCVWIQGTKDEVLRVLANEVEKCTIRKEELGWDLPELEQVAKTMAEEMNGDIDDHET